MKYISQKDVLFNASRISPMLEAAFKYGPHLYSAFIQRLQC